MKERIEKMLVPALNKIKGAFPAKVGQEITIPRTFSGSISGFGAAISQMGLLPALAVYAAEDSGDKGKHRSKILKLVTEVLAGYEHTTLELKDLKTGTDLFHKAIDLYKAENSSNNLEELQDLLLDAAVAVKLALRTYKREGNE